LSKLIIFYLQQSLRSIIEIFFKDYKKSKGVSQGLNSLEKQSIQTVSKMAVNKDFEESTTLKLP